MDTYSRLAAATARFVRSVIANKEKEKEENGAKEKGSPCEETAGKQ